MASSGSSTGIRATLGFAATIVHARRSLTLKLPHRFKCATGLPTGGDRHLFCQQLAEGRYSFAMWHLPLAHG